MSALILKSANHIYKLLKVYLTLAIVGALIVIVVELFVAEPIILLGIFFGISLISTASILWVQAHKLNFEGRTNQKYERPPKLPESLMLIVLPHSLAETILGDLRHDFYRLLRRHGRQSAVTWYTIQSLKILVNATALHFGLNVSGSLNRFLKKQS